MRLGRGLEYGGNIKDTEWHRVVFYNRLAEIAGEYLRKGRSVYIEGRLKTRKWQDKDTGQDRYSTDIVAEQMQMLGDGRDGDSGSGDDHYQGDGGAPRRQPPARQAPPARSAAPAQRPPAPPVTSFADMDDDIPFD